MPDPEITPHERNLRKGVLVRPRARGPMCTLSVLFEDLRLESTAARFTEPIPQIDTTSKNYRYGTSCAGMFVTLNEFASAFIRSTPTTNGNGYAKLRARHGEAVGRGREVLFYEPAE